MGQAESGPQIEPDAENEPQSAEEKSGQEDTHEPHDPEPIVNNNNDALNKAISVKAATLKALKKKERPRSSIPPPAFLRVIPHLRSQKLSTKWPVMDIGTIPTIDLNTWQLTITGRVDQPRKLSFEQLKQIGVQEYTTDFHCVTQWSKLDMKWRGVSMLDLIQFVNPKDDWKYLIQYGADDYTVNVRREDVEREDAFIAFEHDGEPLNDDHGCIRMIIPHLYGWKGSKYLVKLEFSSVDKPGFWEVRGYHNVADAFSEQRYTEDP